MQSLWQIKYVVDEDATDVLDLDFEENALKANFSWFIESEMVIQVNDYI